MAYKSGPPIVTTISGAISDGFSEIQSLRDECSENADNCEGKPQEEAWRNAADELDQHADSEPDVPSEVSDLPCTYVPLVNKDKRRGLARHARLSNAIAAIQAAKDALEAVEPDDEESKTGEALKEAAEELAGNLDDVVGLSVDFPGMFGAG